MILFLLFYSTVSCLISDKYLLNVDNNGYIKRFYMLKFVSKKKDWIFVDFYKKNQMEINERQQLKEFKIN